MEKNVEPLSEEERRCMDEIISDFAHTDRPSYGLARAAVVATALERTEQDNKRLREALKPFAGLAAHHDQKYGNRPWLPEHDILQISSQGLPDASISVGDLRRARAALQPPAIEG